MVSDLENLEEAAKLEEDNDCNGRQIENTNEKFLKKIEVKQQEYWQQIDDKVSDNLLTTVKYNATNLYTSANEVDIVGVGSYGVVRKCWHNSLRNVVVKCMHFGGSSGSISKTTEEASNKVSVLSTFRHHHIVRIYGMTSWSQRCFGIIMEEVRCGNLRDLMIAEVTVMIPWKLRFRIIFQLANALEYLHFHNPKKSYIHLDVKPENVLLTTNLTVKLADFGSLDIALATNAKPTQTIYTCKQYTPLYTAPERLADLNVESTAAMDVYSFSMICYEAITRQEVFHNARVNVALLVSLIADRGQKPDSKLIDAVEQDLKQQESQEFEIFQCLKDIMQNCWCFEPKDRLTTKEVCKRFVNFAGTDSPYEQDINSFKDDIKKKITRDKTDKLSKKVSLRNHFPPFQQAFLDVNDNQNPTASAGSMDE